MYQSLFSLTRNLLIIWPFFHVAGVMIDFAVNLGAVNEVSVRFPWAVGTLVLMGATAILLAWLARRQLSTGSYEKHSLQALPRSQ
jgi:hypothetical protein